LFCSLREKDYIAECVRPFDLHESMHLVYFRPYMIEFLLWAFRECATVSIFTASNSNYAVAIVQRIQDLVSLRSEIPVKFCFVYCLDKCQVNGDRSVLKNLSKMWNEAKSNSVDMDRSNTIIVDDTATTFYNNFENGLFISKYNVVDPRSQEDSELLKMPDRIYKKVHKLGFIFLDEEHLEY
jgi:hypothetical protein